MQPLRRMRGNPYLHINIYHCGSVGTKDPSFELENIGVEASRSGPQRGGAQHRALELALTLLTLENHSVNWVSLWCRSLQPLPLTATVSPLSGLVMLVSVAGVKVTMFASPSLSASLVATRTSPPSLTSMVVTILASRTAAMPASSRSVKNISQL